MKRFLYGIQRGGAGDSRRLVFSVFSKRASVRSQACLALLS